MPDKNFDSILAPFSSILKKMNITAKEIADDAYDFDLPPLDLKIKMQLEEDGFVIENILNNSDITFSAPHEYFLFKKRPVLVYIRDQFISRSNYLNGKFTKYHVCFCKALENAERENRLESRYIITTNTRGNFLVNIMIQGSNIFVEENVYKRLQICQDCLRELNWKNFLDYCGKSEQWWVGGNSYQRERIVKNFNIDEFLSSTKNDLSRGIETLSSNLARKQYSLPREIKDDLKYRCGYKCQKCGKFTVKSDLQIHHRDHNQGNNSLDNLMVVCVDCHKNIHRAEGGYIGDVL